MRYWRKEQAASGLQVKAPLVPHHSFITAPETKAKAATFPQAREPSPPFRRHVESAGAECIFVCCFITCSCFIDGDLKAAKPLYDFWWREAKLGERRQRFQDVSAAVWNFRERTRKSKFSSARVLTESRDVYHGKRYEVRGGGGKKGGRWQKWGQK